MKRGAKPKPCGTPAAYHRHRSVGERPCEDCLAAQSARNAARGIQEPPHACPGCGQPTRSKRVCIDCRHELETGLFFGQWVVRGGIKVWQSSSEVAS
jgi:hypothetical protein